MRLNESFAKLSIGSLKVEFANLTDIPLNALHLRCVNTALNSFVLSEHSVGQLLRQTAPDLVRSIINEHADQYTVKGSCGQSQWAEIPWVSVMDTLVTNTTNRGYYIVYLFSSDLSSILTLGQGVTAIKEEFGTKKQASILAHRADLIRARVDGYEKHFPEKAIELNARTPLGKSYGPGAAFCKRYDANSLPGDDDLASDLLAMVNLYMQLVYAGGVDLVEQPDESVDVEIAVTAEEKKRPENSSVRAVAYSLQIALKHCCSSFKSCHLGCLPTSLRLYLRKLNLLALRQGFVAVYIWINGAIVHKHITIWAVNKTKALSMVKPFNCCGDSIVTTHSGLPLLLRGPSRLLHSKPIAKQLISDTPMHLLLKLSSIAFQCQELV